MRPIRRNRSPLPLGPETLILSPGWRSHSQLLATPVKSVWLSQCSSIDRFTVTETTLPAPSNMNCTWPPITSCSAGPPPL